jgi:glutamate dehydrogenase/leucine dehydrogenase
MEMADDQISVVPDFISNCGMARVFAYLMGDDAEISDDAIFNDTSNIILHAMEKVAEKCPSKKNFSQEAFTIALSEIL